MLTSLVTLLMTFAAPSAHAADACVGVFEGGLVYKDSLKPSMFKNGGSRAAAEAVVDWARNREQRFSIRGQTRVDLMRESQVVLFFHDRDFASIERKGFLNQYQSGKSSGWTRDKDIEDGFLGLKIPEKNFDDVLKFRPKSAFLNITADVQLAEYRGVVSDRYGNIGAVMTDEVKKRSLWSEQDSAKVGGSYVGQWGKQLESDLVAQRGTFYRGRFPKRARDESSAVGSVPYAEAQIYGELGIGDVDHFVVFKAEDALKLSQAGKPIYLVQWAVIKGRDQLVYVQKL